MARITGLPKPPGRVKRLALWATRRRYGKVLEPATYWAHHTGVFWSTMLLEGTLQATRQHLPAALHDLVVHRVSVVIGCPWCIDFGAMEALHTGMTPERVLAVPDYAGSDLFTDAEKRAMAYADAMTATPPTVTDEQVTALREELGECALVELTHLISLENQRSRFNHALGITAQGFTDAEVCALPL